MGPGGRLHTIEALRGLAALAVAWFHLAGGHPEDSVVRASSTLGWLGVDAFFVISGFVIPYALYRANYETRSFWRFMGRRLVRLEPPYIASVALVVVLAYITMHRPLDFYSPPHLAAHALYLIPLTSYDWVQPVYWSLAYEFAFYIVAGLLFTTLWRRPLWLTAGLSLAVFALGFAITGKWDARLMLFLFGIAGMRYFVGRDPLWLFLACVGANATLLVFVAPWSAAVGLATALAVVFVKLPAWAPLMGLGAISYSLYLTHIPIGGRVVAVGMRYVDDEAERLALSLAALGVSLAFAWAFYRAVEVGATRLSKRVMLTRPCHPSQSQPSPPYPTPPAR